MAEYPDLELLQYFLVGGQVIFHFYFCSCGVEIAPVFREFEEEKIKIRNNVRTGLENKRDVQIHSNK